MESIDCVGVNDNLGPRNSSMNTLLIELVDGLIPGLECTGDRESCLNGRGKDWDWSSMLRDLRPLVILR